MADMLGKVCLNHTDTAASSRCVTCFKPLCDQCIITVNGEHFCGQICAQKHQSSNANIEAMRQRQPSSGFFSKAFKLLLLGALIFWAWMYKGKIIEIFDKGKEEINSK